jgi:hypothetical protein
LGASGAAACSSFFSRAASPYSSFAMAAFRRVTSELMSSAPSASEASSTVAAR